MQAGGDLKTGTDIRRLDTAGRVCRIRINQSATKILVSLKVEKRTQVLIVTSGRIVKTIPPPNGHAGAAFSPDGRFDALGDPQGTVICLSLTDPDAPIFEVTVSRSLLNEIDLFLDGDFLHTSSWDSSSRYGARPVRNW